MDSSFSYITREFGNHLWGDLEGLFWGYEGSDFELAGEALQSSVIADSLSLPRSSKVQTVAISLLSRILIRKAAHYLVREAPTKNLIYRPPPVLTPDKEKNLTEVINKSVIIGFNSLLTFGTLLNYPFLSNPLIYVAVKEPLLGKYEFKQISIHDSPDAYPEHKSALVLLKCLHFAKKVLHINLSGVLLQVGSATLLTKLNSSCPPDFRNLLMRCALIGVSCTAAHGCGIALRRYVLQTSSSDLAPLLSHETPLPPSIPKNLGALSPLPIELLRMIRSHLSLADSARVARVSKYACSVFNPIEWNKAYLQQHYPAVLLQGSLLERLASAPLINLKGTIVNPGSTLTPVDWDAQAALLRYSNSDYGRLNPNPACENQSGLQTLYFDKGSPLVPVHMKKLPTVTSSDAAHAHTLLYFINETYMGKAPLICFVDPLERHGFALQVDCYYRDYQNRDKVCKGSGTVILHQLNPRDKEGIWVLIYNIPLHLDLHPEIGPTICTHPDAVGHPKWFMFLHRVNGELGAECTANFKWLASLLSGKISGPLLQGQERIRNRIYGPYLLSKGHMLPTLERFLFNLGLL